MILFIRKNNCVCATMSPGNYVCSSLNSFHNYVAVDKRNRCLDYGWTQHFFQWMKHCIYVSHWSHRTVTPQNQGSHPRLYWQMSAYKVLIGAPTTHNPLLFSVCCIIVLTRCPTTCSFLLFTHHRAFLPSPVQHSGGYSHMRGFYPESFFTMTKQTVVKQ